MTQPVSSSSNEAATPVLLQDLQAHTLGILQREGLVAYPHHWQEPAATERAAFEAMAASGGLEGMVYFGFPWAALIDCLRADASVSFQLLSVLEQCRRALPKGARIVTVAQHIYADRYAPIFSACGVTDVFWSHCRNGQKDLHGMRVYPFALFPAQTPDGPDAADDPHRPRRWLANFIGAHNPKVYLTDVRAQIFEDADRFDDLLIVRRESWHFQRAVYEQQVASKTPEEAQLAAEAKMRDEYLTSIKESTFTLCPSGSGPNSIRVFESLALASIPIILTRELALAGDPALWDAACLVEDDSAEGYRRALARARAMPEAEIRARQAATRKLFDAVGPGAYAKLIARQLGKKAS